MFGGGVSIALNIVNTTAEIHIAGVIKSWKWPIQFEGTKILTESFKNIA